MTRNDLKIKYIIGSYIDNPEYPTKEDLFLIKEKGLPKRALDLLSELIEKGDVEVVKETKHTIYHKISKR